MKKLSKALKAGVVAFAAVAVISAPVFADIPDSCVGADSKNPGLAQIDAADGDYKVRCQKINGKNYYGKTQADCSQLGALASNPETCEGNDLNTIIQMIVNAIIFIIGIVAVVMIILGGISYATSQGDPSKVKKGKDTILYGIIGLVVALLAYAIVNFVLGALSN